MFVAATTECFLDLSLAAALERLADLEYTSVELAMFEDADQFKPSQIAADVEKAAGHLPQYAAAGRGRLRRADHRRQGRRTTSSSRRICRLAKAAKVVTITVPSAELGTPFNEEVEHLRRLVDIATLHGVRVGMKSQIGRLSEDPDTVMRAVRQREGPGPDARSQRLHLRPVPGPQHRQADEVRLSRAAPRHQQKGPPGPRRPGRDRIRPADHAAPEAEVQPGPLREHHAKCPRSITSASSASCGCCWRACSKRKEPNGIARIFEQKGTKATKINNE